MKGRFQLTNQRLKLPRGPIRRQRTPVGTGRIFRRMKSDFRIEPVGRISGDRCCGLATVRRHFQRLRANGPLAALLTCSPKTVLSTVDQPRGMKDEEA
jgi:hypothetical protein